MKTICITGTHATDVDFIQGILTQAGMGQAQSPQRDTSLTIDFWHEQVEARIKEMPAQVETVELGRVWEQIASDIFVANMSQQTWGWADTRSARVLDFWQQFDPQVRFVLVACSAQRHIAHALAAGALIDSVKALMTEWVTHQLLSLQFLHRFPQKTILVDVEQCIGHPEGLIKACQQLWQLNLSKVHFPTRSAIQFTTLEQFLARELSQTDDQWQVLQSELWSSATPVGSLWKISSQINVFDAVKAYRSDKTNYIESQATSAERLMAERLELSKLLEAANAHVASLKDKVDVAKIEADSAKAEVDKLKADFHVAKAEADAAQSALALKTLEANPLAGQLKDAQEESELLLVQHHQVQEELEKIFLENQDFKNKIIKIEPLEAKAQDLSKKLEVVSTQVIKLQKEAEEAKAEALSSLKKSEINAEQLVTSRKESATLKTKIDELVKQLDTTKSQAANSHKEAEKAKAEALASLKKNEINAEQLVTSRKESATLKSKIEELVKQLDTTKSQAANSHKEAEKAKAEALASLKKNEINAEQLVTSRKESATLKSKIEELVKHLDTTKSQVANSHKEVALAKAEVLAVKAALTQKISEPNPLTGPLKDAKEESQLLLAQLHQVQEELEHYFLKHQDSKNALESNELRWKRMLQRQPDYFDLESIEIVNFGDAKSFHMDWRLKGLEAAGRLIPELRLTSTVEGGVACLELPRRMGEQLVFVRWPMAASNKATLTVAVVGDANTGRERADILLQLSRSDWDLVHVILNVLINEIQTPGLLQFSKEFSSENVLESLKALKAKLAQLPPVFRFDEIKLKREQVNPDYEHLWLDFSHVAIGAKRLLDFDFRVSCAHIRPKTFGEYPKLEFPETSGRAAITGWFDEAYDDFGAKLELRFSFPQSMDLHVWEQLPEPDRLFLSSLINQIPALLSELETSGVQVKRGWSDWQQMAQEVRRILAICIARKTEIAKVTKVAVAPKAAPANKKSPPPSLVATKRQAVKR